MYIDENTSTRKYAELYLESELIFDIYHKVQAKKIFCFQCMLKYRQQSCCCFKMGPECDKKNITKNLNKNMLLILKKGLYSNLGPIKSFGRLYFIHCRPLF